jgi:hypothetical protein
MLSFEHLLYGYKYSRIRKRDHQVQSLSWMKCLAEMPCAMEQKAKNNALLQNDLGRIFLIPENKDPVLDTVDHSTGREKSQYYE